jgi:hypothetical protein
MTGDIYGIDEIIENSSYYELLDIQTKIKKEIEKRIEKLEKARIEKYT